jgi:PAS domain S-box-containing protein
MNAVGNDNYRADLKPPEPIKRSGGWLSSNMAQLMVFLNGLILTITAFATLSVFIDEIVKDGFIKTTDEVEQYIDVSYVEAERSLNALAAIVSMSKNGSDQVIKDYMEKESSGSAYINEVYLVFEGESPSSVKTLHGDAKFLKSFNSNLAFKDFIHLQVNSESKDIHLAVSLPNIKPDAVENDEKVDVHQRSFALIKSANMSDGTMFYIVGVTNFNNILPSEWVFKRSVITDIQITDTKSDFPIYSYRPKDVGSRQDTLYTNLFTTNIADRSFNVKIDMMIHARESFLKKIPLLMLLFGITLTLIGTLYVRNNQTQSKKLSTMNKELAHKNFELNQEVSERARLSQVIQQSERENRSIINSVSDIIFELSNDGKILFLNDAWNVVTGFESERSIGRNLFDLLYVPDQDAQKESFQNLLSGKGKSYRSFTRLRSADGSFRAIELAMSMTRQDDNNKTRVVGTITDVEERRRAERALSEAEKKYRTIVENAAGGIYQVTPDGQFLSANPAMAKILGYNTPEEVLRDVDKEQNKHYIDVPARNKFLADITALDITKNIESQITRKDRSVIWVRENVRPVRDDEGTLLFYEGSMEDVDQRKKAEIALTQAKIDSDLANRAKSEFLANMSHELRTPLNAVIGFSEIIKNEAFGKLPNKEYKEYADDIHDSGNKLLRVINEILDVSRIEAGERTLNETVVKVKDTVKSCLDLIEGKLKSTGTRVENKIKDDDLGFIGEVQSVKQMLLNLMSNAMKFSTDNSFMMIDAEIDSTGRLRLSVTDTGMGMNDEELEKALSPFGQVDTDLNRSKSGTGLGLTLVKSLIELHGGALEMVSQKGIGTTATLIFPAKRVAQVGESTVERSQNEVFATSKDA